MGVAGNGVGVGRVTGDDVRGWFAVVGGNISLEGGGAAAVAEVGAWGCWSAFFFLRCFRLDGVAGVVIEGWEGWAG